jgi:hypothetical protein
MERVEEQDDVMGFVEQLEYNGSGAADAENESRTTLEEKSYLVIPAECMGEPNAHYLGMGHAARDAQPFENETVQACKFRMFMALARQLNASLTPEDSYYSQGQMRETLDALNGQRGMIQRDQTIWRQLERVQMDLPLIDPANAADHQWQNLIRVVSITPNQLGIEVDPAANDGDVQYAAIELLMEAVPESVWSLNPNDPWPANPEGNDAAPVIDPMAETYHGSMNPLTPAGQGVVPSADVMNDGATRPDGTRARPTDDHFTTRLPGSRRERYNNIIVLAGLEGPEDVIRWGNGDGQINSFEGLLELPLDDRRRLFDVLTASITRRYQLEVAIQDFGALAQRETWEEYDDDVQFLLGPKARGMPTWSCADFAEPVIPKYRLAGLTCTTISAWNAFILSGQADQIATRFALAGRIRGLLAAMGFVPRPSTEGVDANTTSEIRTVTGFCPLAAYTAVNAAKTAQPDFYGKNRLVAALDAFYPVLVNKVMFNHLYKVNEAEIHNSRTKSSLEQTNLPPTYIEMVTNGSEDDRLFWQRTVMHPFQPMRQIKAMFQMAHSMNPKARQRLHPTNGLIPVALTNLGLGVAGAHAATAITLDSKVREKMENRIAKLEFIRKSHACPNVQFHVAARFAGFDAQMRFTTEEKRQMTAILGQIEPLICAVADVMYTSETDSRTWGIARAMALTRVRRDSPGQVEVFKEVVRNQIASFRDMSYEEAILRQTGLEDEKDEHEEGWDAEFNNWANVW